jgi:hypothetical protein
VEQNGNNNNNGNMKLKPDAWIKRKYSPKIKEMPKKPLTDDEKKRLEKSCFEKCHKAYRNRMIHSGLISDFEEAGDLEGEAWIAMQEIMNRFDLSKCGIVAKHDTEGKTAPKTLEFYFLNYFYGRVNFMACESRTHKKSRNVQFSNSQYDEIEYNPVDMSSGGAANQNYEITGHIMNGLQNKSKHFQRFFYQTYVLQCSYKELVDEYGQDSCKQRKEELQEFVEGLKKNHKQDFASGKKGERGRKKKQLITAK